MDFIDKGAYEEEYESAPNNLLELLVKNTSQTIQFESIGYTDTDRIHSHIYCMVEFKYSKYTLQ